MFRQVTQSSPLSLFSSTSSQPLALFEWRVDASLPEDSGIVLVHDAKDEIVYFVTGNDNDDDSRWTMRGGLSKAGAEVLEVSDTQSRRRLQRGLLDEVVLHIQSPTMTNAYIQSGRLFRSNGKQELGIQLGMVHLQIRLLGDSRPFSFEVGVRDQDGRPARLRWSTFKSKPTLYSAVRQEDDGSDDHHCSHQGSALLHLPLVKPPSMRHDPSVLTPWVTIAAPVAATCSKLASPPASIVRGNSNGGPRLLPFSEFESISYVRIYSNCRLRRIWLTDHRQQGPMHNPDEFALASMPFTGEISI